MLIITGTGRSGTETIARMFGGHHEFRAAYILEKYFSGPNPHANPFYTIEERIQAVMDLHQGIASDQFIDSSNLYIHFIDAIAILNPSCRFILSVRNGKDFVRSAFTRRWHGQNAFGTIPEYSDPYFSKWKDMNPFQKNAWIWTWRNGKAIAGLGRVPEEQKLIVRIEDISRQETIGRIEAFSGRKIKNTYKTDKRYNASPSFSFPSKEEWTEEMNAQFNEIAGEMMAFFGYH